MSQESVEVASGVRSAVSRSSQKASRHRSLDERIFVRFPSLYRALAGRLFQLPPRSRLRRLILDRVARRAVAAANRRDLEVLLYGVHPAIEFELPDSPEGGYVPPDLTGVHRGHAGYRYMWEGMLEAWPDLTPWVNRPADSPSLKGMATSAETLIAMPHPLGLLAFGVTEVRRQRPHAAHATAHASQRDSGRPYWPHRWAILAPEPSREGATIAYREPGGRAAASS
jgi:hypothetical protein